MSKILIFPCCGKELPAPLGGVALATCACGQSFLPKVIIDYNEMIDIITGWRDVVNGKALLIAEPGEEKFIANLIRRGLVYTKSPEIKVEPKAEEEESDGNKN